MAQETWNEVAKRDTACEPKSSVARIAYLDQTLDLVAARYLRINHPQMSIINQEEAIQVVQESSAEYRLQPVDSAKPQSLKDWGDLTPYLRHLQNRAKYLLLDPNLKARLEGADLAQEAWASVLGSTVPCRGTAKAQRFAYIDRAFDRVLVDHLRLHHADMRNVDREAVIQRSQNSSAEHRHEAVDPGDSPSQHAAQREDYLRIMVGIDRREPNERDVLVLHYMQGLNNAETAEWLGVDPGTTSRRYWSGLKKVRAEVNPE